MPLPLTFFRYPSEPAVAHSRLGRGLETTGATVCFGDLRRGLATVSLPGTAPSPNASSLSGSRGPRRAAAVMGVTSLASGAAKAVRG